jgi:hypothetical protein
VSLPRCHMISATRSREICCSIRCICPLADCARVSNDRNDRTADRHDRRMQSRCGGRGRSEPLIGAGAVYLQFRAIAKVMSGNARSHLDLGLPSRVFTRSALFVCQSAQASALFQRCLQTSAPASPTCGRGRCDPALPRTTGHLG